MAYTTINRPFIQPACFHDRQIPLGRKFLRAAISLFRGRRIDQPCLLKSEVLYYLMRLIKPGNDYRVNLIVTFYCSGDKGHAWLSRNGQPLFRSDIPIAADRLTLLGETDRYRYYIKESNLHKWYDIDLPACLVT